MKNLSEIKSKEFQSLPVKVLQFGEGNFLRAFADWYIEKANRMGVFNGRVLIAKPTDRGSAKQLTAQNCFYTVLSRGRDGGKIIEDSDVISSVSECISCYDDCGRLLASAESPEISVVISNTTEAGIVYNNGEKLSDFPYVSFPAKLTAVLYHRYKTLGRGSGLLILPVELIENNGKALLNCVLRYADDWKLGDDFINYLTDDCKFCSTLVDRIVTGFPSDEYESITKKLGYEDNLLVACEPYHSWIIEGREEWKNIFPVHLADSSVVWTNDLSAYRERKVKILNGAHTMSAPAAYLCGFDIVRDMMRNPYFSAYIKKGLFNEILPTLKLPYDESKAFADAVFERFDNPFIDHRLLDISLNSVSKYKTRCLPSVLDYKEMTGKLPKVLIFSLAALLVFYNGAYDENGDFYAERNGIKYRIRDSRAVTDFFYDAYKSEDVVGKVLSNRDFWDVDLTEIDGMYNAVRHYFDILEKQSIKNAVKRLVADE